MKHVPVLSPSWNLFKTYLNLRDARKWNTKSFSDVYVPTFLREMRSKIVRKKLTELIELDRRGKHICLACFCPDESLCHRSIIAGILQNAGVLVRGVHADYSRYGSLWCTIP